MFEVRRLIESQLVERFVDLRHGTTTSSCSRAASATKRPRGRPAKCVVPSDSRAIFICTSPTARGSRRMGRILRETGLSHLAHPHDLQQQRTAQARRRCHRPAAAWNTVHCWPPSGCAMRERGRAFDARTPGPAGVANLSFSAPPVKSCARSAESLFAPVTLRCGSCWSSTPTPRSACQRTACTTHVQAGGRTSHVNVRTVTARFRIVLHRRRSQLRRGRTRRARCLGTCRTRRTRTGPPDAVLIGCFGDPGPHGPARELARCR